MICAVYSSRQAAFAIIVFFCCKVENFPINIYLMHYKWHSCTGTPSLFLACLLESHLLFSWQDQTERKGVDMTGVTCLWWRLLCYRFLQHFHSGISQQWWRIKRICLGLFICDCLLEMLNWHSSYWFPILLILLRLLRFHKGRPVGIISFSESNYKF